MRVEQRATVTDERRTDKLQTRTASIFSRITTIMVMRTTMTMMEMMMMMMMMMRKTMMRRTTATRERSRWACSTLRHHHTAAVEFAAKGQTTQTPLSARSDEKREDTGTRKSPIFFFCKTFVYIYFHIFEITKNVRKSHIYKDYKTNIYLRFRLFGVN